MPEASRRGGAPWSRFTARRPPLTVGFAGPNQQYTLAIMYNLGSYDESGNAGFKYGTNKLTQIASLLFQGHHTPGPHPLPSAVP